MKSVVPKAAVLRIISRKVDNPQSTLGVVHLSVDRLTLAKRRWRGVAGDGAEFGFELGMPLRHGETFWEDDARYVIAQQPEPVLVIPLDLPPSAAAGIGWAIGNLHFELSAEPARLLAPDDPAVRQLLTRIAVPFECASAVFRPGHFSRAGLARDLGPGHKHAP